MAIVMGSAANPGGSSGSMARRRPLSDVPTDARQYAVAMRDGVRLATDVYLPAGQRRWPTLVCRLPYDKAGDECFMPEVARWFTERGYAVVVQDVRGKVRSDGDFVPFEAEIADGYDTLEWVTSQRWATGAVGMIGDSYYGFTQWAAAASEHRALCAITPRVASADFGGLLSPGGVFLLEVWTCWALETWIDDGLYDFDGRLDWSVRPLRDIIPAVLAGRRALGLDGWMQRGARPGGAVPVTGRIPALHMGGFADFVLPGQLATWRRARAGGPAPHYLILDSTDHSWTSLRAPGEAYVDPHTSTRAMSRFLDRYLGPLLPFYEHFVAARNDYAGAAIRWRAGRDRAGWREDDCWPPRRARPISWFLVADGSTGALSSYPHPVESQVTWAHDPADPVPSCVHPYYPLVEPPDESTILRRDDVTTYFTEPWPQPLTLAGPVTVTARLSSSAPSMHLMAVLYDVYPNGRAHRILDGAVAVRAPWPAHAEIQLGDTGYVVAEGHRLQVSLSSSAFPKYALHPGTDEDCWTATTTSVSQQQLALGGSQGAVLTCHVLPEEGPTS